MSNLTSELKTLSWGETPFDDMSREELLRHCQRFYAACESMVSCLAIIRAGDEYHRGKGNNPYWGPGGSGAHGLAQGEQALDAARVGIDSESIYRSFFRYARDLLFESKGEMRLGFDWYICETCKVMTGACGDERGTDRTGQSCSDTFRKCTGTIRRITWDDLKPLENAEVSDD